MTSTASRGEHDATSGAPEADGKDSDTVRDSHPPKASSVPGTEPAAPVAIAQQVTVKLVRERRRGRRSGPEGAADETPRSPAEQPVEPLADTIDAAPESLPI